MSAGLYSAIGNYLTHLHTDVIWPTLVGTPTNGANRSGGGPAPQPVLGKPDKLVFLQYVLMRMYSKAVTVFESFPRPCTDTERDCRQGEECIDGVCTPVGPGMFSEGQRCTSTEQCHQGEECIDGVCTPVPSDLVFAPVSNVPDYAKTHELKTALAAYYDKIGRVLIAGLAKNPARIAAVRNVLLQGYADCCKVGGIRKGPCKDSGDCDDASVCIDGICVPIPFRLVFRQSTDPIELP